MFFAIGFFLLMAGVAILFQGAFTLPNGWAIATRPARQIGGFFVSYLPILIAIRLIVSWFADDWTLNTDVIYAILTLAYIAGAVILFVRALSPSAPRNTPAEQRPAPDE